MDTNVLSVTNKSSSQYISLKPPKHGSNFGRLALIMGSEKPGIKKH